MSKPVKIILVAFIAMVLVVCSFGGGLVAGRFIPGLQAALPGAKTPVAANPAQGGTPTDLQNAFVPFWEAWNYLHQYYVDQPVDNTKLIQGAISGMMDSLGDSHNIYLNPQAWQDENSTLQGSYAGIGAYVDTNGTLLTISKPMPDSPALKAGLKTGDQIIAINGEDVTSLPPEAVRQRVLGPAGTKVKLTIQRPGESAPMDFEITREQIIVPTVTSKMLDNNIAYIELTSFSDTTAADLHKQLGDLMAQNPKGLILDLRYNGGGYLDTAISVASEFIPSGVVVVEKAGDGTSTNHNAIAGGLATDAKLPMVVLVNAYSASASEIVAGALQDYGRAKLVGETTYGKGSVQYPIQLSNNQGGIAVTVAKWFTPKGRSIDKKGLTPDIEVKLTADDATAGKDPQLDAAIQQLTSAH